MKKVVIIGGEGTGIAIAATIVDCQKAGQKIECVGFLNDFEKKICDYKVLGGVKNQDWKKLPEDYSFVFAFSNIENAPAKYSLIKQLSIPEHRMINIIHPTAVISHNARLGCGIVIMPFVYVGPNVELHNYVRIMGHSYIAHDCKLGEMTFVANNASVNGFVTVGKGVHLGSNSSILEKISIGDYSVIGMGAVVIRDVHPKSKMAGNPARLIGRL